MNQQLELPMEYPDNGNIIKPKTKKPKDNDPFHQVINGQLNFSSRYQFPKIAPFNYLIPYGILSIDRIKGTKRIDLTPHFYVHDHKYSGLRSFANKYIDILRKYPSVIGPDFSVQPQMPLKEKEYIIFLNKKITAWMQRNGIKVIPNIIWCEGVDPNYCFDGFPKHSVIAINSTGIGNDLRSKQGWIEGDKKVIEILQPTHIIRYGAKQEGEYEEISTYFDNDNRKGGE